MSRLFKGSKKILLLLLSCNVILICCLFIKRNLDKDRVTITSNMQLPGKQCNSERLLVNTYLTRIVEVSDNFYDEYYTISPVVNYYSTNVKSFLSDDRLSFVTFTSNPYLGPHDSIGIDEITFSADYKGTIKLENFDHIISYHLPDNLKSLEKKRVPGKYGDE